MALVASLVVLSELELHTGRLERATAAAAEALERARELDLSRQVAWALVCSAEVEAVLGRVDDCRAHSAEAVATRAPEDEVIEAYALDALGRLELGAGNARSRFPSFERVRELAGSSAGGTPYLRWRPDLIEGYVRAKRVPEAAAELAAFEKFEDTGLGPWATATLARSRALLADEGSLDDAFAEALSSCEDSVSPFERARTRPASTASACAGRAGALTLASGWAALGEFERLGASSWAERTREELRASGETARKRDPALVDQLTRESSRSHCRWPTAPPTRRSPLGSS